MATKATQANTDSTDAEGNGQTIYASGLAAFGKQTFESAIKATKKALHDVQSGDEAVKTLEQKIEEKKAGNATRLIILARECVSLTMSEDGKVADLIKAADLMEGACKYVETITEIDYRKANPEATEAKIRHIVPSWPALRSDFINAMRKAKLDPNSFFVADKDKGKEIPQPTAMRNAYKEWKENPDNAGELAVTGRKPRAAESGQTDAKTKEVAAAVAKLSDSAKSVLANLATAMEQLDDKQQKKAVELLTITLGEVRNLAAAGEDEKDEKAGVQTRRRPTPARVPESNQIAS